jgi:hypothetical protein
MSNRISIEIDSDEHKYLKMCCAKLGISIKEFVLNATLECIDAWEDEWMLERWEKDGTNESIKKELSDPNHIVYLMKRQGDDFSFVETTYSDVRGQCCGV